MTAGKAAKAKYDNRWVSAGLAACDKSQADLAKRLRLAGSGMSRLINGEREITLAEAVSICAFFADAGHPEIAPPGFNKILSSADYSPKLSLNGQDEGHKQMYDFKVMAEQMRHALNDLRTRVGNLEADVRELRADQRASQQHFLKGRRGTT